MTYQIGRKVIGNCAGPRCVRSVYDNSASFYFCSDECQQRWYIETNHGNVCCITGVNYFPLPCPTHELEAYRREEERTVSNLRAELRAIAQERQTSGELRELSEPTHNSQATPSGRLRRGRPVFQRIRVRRPTGNDAA